MHDNFFAFSARSHKELGYKMGIAFEREAKNALKKETSNGEWKQKVNTALRMLPIAKNVFPQYVEELVGYAEGAKVSFDDFWTLCLEDDAFSQTRKDVAKCTTLVTNDGYLIGHTEDYHAPGFSDAICIVKKTIRDFSTLELFYYNTLGGSSIGVNSAGFVHAVNTLLYTRKRIGLPKNVIARFLLDTTNPEADLSQVKHYVRASGFGHTITSKEGCIWQAEITSATAKVRQPQLPFCHTNHCLINRPGTSIRNLYGTNARLQFAQENVKRHMTPLELQMLLNDCSKGKHNSLFNERTIGKMIVNQKSQEILIWLQREDKKGWVSYRL